MKELISLTSLVTTIKGIDVCNAIVNARTEREIDLSKIVSLTTHGACSRTREQNGVIKLFIEHIEYLIL